MSILLMSISCAAACDIHIEKDTNGYDADTTADQPEITAGNLVTWTYKVTCTGASFYGVKVTDNMPVSISYVSGDDGDKILQTTETWTYQATGTATLGQYENTGTASGWYYIQLHRCKIWIPDCNWDKSHYFGTDPAIPEFPTIALPMAAIIGLAFVFMRREE
ncbi:MAG: PEF-CTERM sorting domain-containing protein [Methanosarcinaceae archaeon]|nr:PEF-CTERM sorting domain-containing protein [Methanosarcinaceae archaeon]